MSLGSLAKLYEIFKAKRKEKWKGFLKNKRWDPFKAFHSYRQYFKLLIINTLDVWKDVTTVLPTLRILSDSFLIFTYRIIMTEWWNVIQDVFSFCYCDTKCFLNICMSHLLLNALKKIFIISPYWVTIFKCLCINFLLHTSVFKNSLIFKSCILSNAGSMHHFNLISLSTTSEYFNLWFSKKLYRASSWKIVHSSLPYSQQIMLLNYFSK